MIIAVGTGTFAAFESMTRWRENSNEASYELTNVHDLRGRLGTGSFLPEGTLSAAALQIDHAELIDGVEERLLVPSQVDASTEDQDVLVRGRVIGVDVSNGGPHVDTPYAAKGRMLTASDAGEDVALLEYNFARQYSLPETGEIILGGGRPMAYIGQAMHPEYFIVVPEEGGFFGERNFAAVFTSLETAGRIAGQPGMVNDVVIRLVDGADRDLVEAELLESLGSLGSTVVTIDDDDSYTTVVRDVEGDQDTTRVISFAVLVGAVFAAFNLTSRMVEAQRRDIGISMALGVPRWLIGIRPMLVGLQIAVLGVVLGMGVGYVMGLGIRELLTTLIATPVVETPFQFDIYAGAAALGIIGPLLAISLPVWLAVRVNPVDAIRTGHLAARGWGIAPLLRRLPVPGGSLAQMPFRNLLRAPRRTLLTVVAVTASLAVLVGVLAVLDGILDAGDRTQAHVVSEHPERIIIELDTVYGLDSREYASIASSPALISSEPITRVGATVASAEEEISVFLDFVDFQSLIWRPSVGSGELDPSVPGIVISEKAREDLGLGLGDLVRVRHPVREGASFRIVESELPLLAIHGDAFRTYVYIDRSHLELAGLAGTANQVTGLPAAGFSEGDVKRALLDVPAVGSVQSAETLGDVFGDFISDATVLLYLLVGAAVILAGLIAFNSAAINADERRREHATMFAFGVPPSRVLLISVAENALVGVVATAFGLLGGFAFAQWMFDVIIGRTLPDMEANVTFAVTTIAIAIFFGVVAVAVAPVFTYRKMRAMDIPSTLRVME